MATRDGQTTPSTYERPKTRQRLHKTPEPLAVPDIDEDAAERKCVLNVLAQRRYHGNAGKQRLQQHHQQQMPTALATPGVVLDTVPDTVPEQLTTVDSPGLAAGPAMDLPFGPSFGLDLDLAMEESLDFGAFLQESLPQSLSQSLSPSLLPFSGSETTTSEPLALPFHSDPSPDPYYLPMPELQLLGAALRVIDRLGGDPNTAFWKLDAVSPFYEGEKGNEGNEGNEREKGNKEKRNAEHEASLPVHWRPTEAQRRLLHHPVLDVLPWPSTREKLIGIFHLPAAMRPAPAADPLGLVQLVYDLEDSAEGDADLGGDPYDATGYEVGQRVFERWWFVFDGAIVEQSNRWRRLRGQHRCDWQEVGEGENWVEEGKRERR